MTDKALESAPGILVIEDEALVARDIQSRLTQLGYRVIGLAHNPRQALALAGQSRPDLLLCDIHLKEDVDGIEVARSITEQWDIPVIFLTAYSDRETVTRAKSIAPYGYVLKPIETQDLQIAVEMALHKFAIEQELRSTRQLLATALQCIGDALVFVGADGNISNMNAEAEHLFGLQSAAATGLNCLELLEEKTGAAQSAALSWQRLLKTTAVTRLPPFQLNRSEGSLLLVDGVIGPTQGGEQGNGLVLILRRLAELEDAVDNLSLPAELPADFNQLYDYPYDHERAFVLLLISPDQPEELMSDLREEKREALIKEIGEQLNLAMRGTDLASYYGGTVFSASLPYTTLEEASSIASAILQRLAQHRFLSGSIELKASIGVSHHRPGRVGGESESPLELFRRANRALILAQQSGGNRVAIWRPSTDIGLVGNLDNQSGLLTADAGQDYRNMALLWNTMSSVAATRDTSALADMLVGRVRRSFDLEQVALYMAANGSYELVAGDPVVTVDDSKLLTGLHERLFSAATSSQRPQQAENSYCIPVEFDSSRQGVLYLRSTKVSGGLRQQDLLLVRSLIDYITGPVGSTLPGVGIPPPEVESESELLYQSSTMAEVMELIRLVAPTDETVLITGESGTGKEIIAREIHRLSKRADAPFVIVDCGAVVSTLIERELFGHVRGAFTGATHSSPGKLKDADGGTLLLDEIGELPLDVQVKLLRVVQEKQFTAVGSTRVETANTRIIAATNVDLDAEIKQGKFREDLYYRLNVFNVHSPPLRLRDGDIAFLAEHFLQSCSAQYGRDILGFTPAAMDVLLRYRWPGNIRELRNRLIRAVILCQGNYIDVAELDLRRETDRPPAKSDAAAASTTAVFEPPEESLAEIESALRDAMSRQVGRCLETGQLPPLSQWLEEDLILTALDLHGQINLQAAETLGMPESTLRRKLARYKEDHRVRPPQPDVGWKAVLELLPQWIRIARREQLDTVQHLQYLLLSEIRGQARSQAEAAALVGVSPPTYRRQLSQLAEW